MGTQTRGRRDVVVPALVLTAVLAVAGALTATQAQAATGSGAVISNGTVQLGVNAQGSLNYDCGAAGDPVCPPASVETDVVGLRFVPLNLESTAPGCLCEGWGVADAASGLTGFANEAAGDANITVDSFNAPSDSQAISTVTISDPAIPGHQLRVVQDYHPVSLSPNLYAASVAITNTGANAIGDLRYRRVMDWDVEPTAFSEWSTIQGTSSQLLFDSDDGFADSDPLSGPTYINSEVVCGPDYTGPCAFTDLGSGGTYPTVTTPDDLGGLFDFGFGALGPGETKRFTVYYGAAPSETDAIRALNAGGAQVYSLGESSCDGDTVDTCTGTGAAGPEQGKPATFMFGFTTAEADLAIQKLDEPDPVEINRDLTYTLRVTNNGPEEARGVQVVDQLPQGVQFVSASGPGACVGPDSGAANVTCDFGSIPNGASVDAKVVVRPTGFGKLTNTATVSSASGDNNQGNNTATQETTVGQKHCGVLIDGVDVRGDSGKDNLQGTERSDRLRGEGGGDRLAGSDGADCLAGDSGNDQIRGDDDDDIIKGGSGDDKISAGKGKDKVRAQNGQDKVNGGPGADFLKVQGRGTDTVNCGGGADRIIGDRKDEVAANCEKVKIVDPA